ncbi:MAG: DHH family phosphoesterase [Clostridia bacterium]|nr:DHH family phosphoesterase [Clostridia bacterium]
MSFISTIITSGSTYLDIDAYACSIALAELLRLKGVDAVAYSDAPCNYSVCPSLVSEGQLTVSLPEELINKAEYIIVDVSDPDYLKDNVPLANIVEVYDHHVGFEEYWASRIGEGARIEFIGAAATLIYREWKKAGLEDKMSEHTAELLVAAILDNTLNLTSSNTTAEDIEVFETLCKKAGIGEEWCDAYFSEVQKSVEADLKNALFNDLKRITDNKILPPRMAQLCVWDAESIIKKLPEIRLYFDGKDNWLMNIIDIKHRCSYFVSDNSVCQAGLEDIFGIRFESGVARSPVPYLRKEIIKHIISKNIGG